MDAAAGTPAAGTTDLAWTPARQRALSSTPLLALNFHEVPPDWRAEARRRLVQLSERAPGLDLDRLDQHGSRRRPRRRRSTGSQPDRHPKFATGQRKWPLRVTNHRPRVTGGALGAPAAAPRCPDAGPVSAHVLPDGDPRARQQRLGQPWAARINATSVRGLGTDLLTVRMDRGDS